MVADSVQGFTKTKQAVEFLRRNKAWADVAKVGPRLLLYHLLIMILLQLLLLSFLLLSYLTPSCRCTPPGGCGLARAS